MIGEKFHHYIVTRLIGEGGMATVYEAVHEKLQTKVAVKVLNPILTANSNIRKRFENEARFMASLTHPNITRVVDYEERPDLLAIILEFLEGQDLGAMIKQKGPLSLDETVACFSQVLDAFDYAHKKGIVHRDVKPSNIFLEPSNIVKILDFGIAKLVGAGDDMTMTGTQIGTPVYMSPEQVNTDKSLDHRSDIYSLGVTLYYLLKGEPPYDSTTHSSFQIYTKIVHEPLPELAKYPEIDKVIRVATDKDRTRRYQSCREFRQALIEAASPKKPVSEPISPAFNSEKTLIDIPEPVKPAPKPVIEQKEKKKPAEKKQEPLGAPPRSKKLRNIVLSALGVIGIIIAILFSINSSWLSQIFVSKEEKQAEAKHLLDLSKPAFKKEIIPHVYDSAVYYLQKAAKLDPENQEIQYYLGNVLYRSELIDSVDIRILSYKNTVLASDALEKAILINPEYKGEIISQDPYTALSAIWGDMAMKYIVNDQNDSALITLREGKKRGAFSDVSLDVGRNLLKSCDQDAILFIQYAIPSYPVLYLQMVENLRTDVKPVHVLFLETTWYYSYLKKNLSIPFSFGETWLGLMDDKKWETQEVTVDNVNTGKPVSWWVYSDNEGNLSKLDQVILDIITTNKFSKPVHYSVIFDFSKGLLNLGSYLKPEGLVYKLKPEIQNDWYKSQQNTLQSLSFNIVKNSSLPSPDMRYILDIVRNVYLILSKYYNEDGDRVNAKAVKRMMEENLPLANYPFYNKEIEKSYNTLVKELDYTDAQRIQNEQSEIREYLTKNNLVGTPTASGLYYIETKAGTGAKAKSGNTVKVHYTGTFLDGTKFDSSYDRSEPFEFKLGAGRVIKGWDEGIAMMRLGSKGFLIIPYDLGYGKSSSGSTIPPYSTTVYEVELMNIN